MVLVVINIYVIIWVKLYWSLEILNYVFKIFSLIRLWYLMRNERKNILCNFLKFIDVFV